MSIHKFIIILHIIFVLGRRQSEDTTQASTSKN